MTYTYKLSRRLALAQIPPMLASLALLAACTSSNPTESSSSPGDREAVLTDLIVTPRRIVLEPNQPLALAGLRTHLRSALETVATEWSATGGRVTADGVFSASETGTYKVVGKRRGRSKHDTTVVVVAPTPETLQELSISPDPASVLTAHSHVFTASGVLSDGSVVETAVTWEATGGTIDAGGLYTAGTRVGTFRVVARSVSTTLADTAEVAIESSTESPPPPAPTPTAIVLAPSSASLEAGTTRQFSATLQLSDGTSSAATVTYTATGGTITGGGLYTAGSTAGTYRVIATQSGGTLADTAAVTVTVSTAQPATGATYFLADAESGTYAPWVPSGSTGWQLVQQNGTVTNSTTRPRSGGRAWKYEVTSHASATIGHDVRTMTAGPQTRMDPAKPGYVSGYYSFWAYVDAGYTAPGWNLLLGWMSGLSGAPSPIGHIGLQLWPEPGGPLQLYYRATNAFLGNCYTAPQIAGYQNASNGWYFMTPQSPAGVVPFPRQRWVHVAVHYEMAKRPNGRVRVWQDGVLVMDLPGLDTWGAHGGQGTVNPCENTTGDMYLQAGIYGGPKSDGVQRLYVDDFKVTSARPLP